MSQREHIGSTSMAASLALAALVVFAAIIGMYYLATGVRQQVDDLATANSDNTQWLLSQAEVDLLSFENVLHRTSEPGATEMGEVRKRFDIFYSRIRLIEQSSQFLELRKIPEVTAGLADIRSFLNEAAPIVDGDDSSLRSAVPMLLGQMAELRPSVREISLKGIENFALVSDRQREDAASTISRISTFTAILVVALLVLVFFLLRLVQIGRQIAAVQATTKDRLEAVVKTSLDAVLVVDSDSRILDFNGAAERIFGYSISEAIGADMAELIIPDHLRTAHATGMKRHLETGEKRVVDKGLVQLEAKRKDGTVFPVEFSISSTKGEGREYFVSYLRDISQRVAAQQELIETRDKAVAGEEAKARLLAVMSHEMRTPLNGLLGTMELLRGTMLTHRQQDYLEVMQTSGDLLLHHVNDVLDISRLDAGNIKLDREIFDANALLSELALSQKSVAEGRGNRIVVDTPDRALTSVSGDPNRLRQVLINLIGNAVKFTRNGEIRVEAEGLDQGDMVEFRIIDDGIGISEEDIDRVFDDFVTLDTSYVRVSGGTGLGLGICRRLVNAMGGEIGVESQPDEGSLFWVHVPLKRVSHLGQPATDTDDETSDAMKKASKKFEILLVEDNKINRFVAREMLEKAGHSVSEAHNGLEGVKMADLSKVDLILMDISMPEMDGIAATESIRKGNGPNAATPIVALTAHALPEEVERFLSAGMDDTLVKPISKSAIGDLLARLLENSEEDGRVSETEDPRMAELDQTVLDELRDSFGDAKLAELVNEFISETEAVFSELAELGPSTGPEIAGSLHKIAGSAAVFGASDLRRHLHLLESAAKAGEPVDIFGGDGGLSEVWQSTVRALRDVV